MKIKKVMLSLMTAVMITGTFSMTAFANAEETADETETTVKEEQTEDVEESAETGVCGKPYQDYERKYLL